MRPPSVYANPSCPAGCACDVVGLLHGPHRVGARLAIILLSHHGLPATRIAELLGCDPATVRRWIHRYNTHGTAALADRPRPGRPRLGSPRLGERIRRLLARPGAWTIPRIWQQLGRPAISLRTLHRRVGEVAAWRRARLVAKGDPDRDQTLAALRQTLAELPQGAVVLAEDETHLNLLPWVRDQPTRHLSRARSAVLIHGRLRSLHRSPLVASRHATASTDPRFHEDGRPPGQAPGRGRTMTEASVSFAGNLTDDPEVRHTHDGIARDMVGSGSYLVMDTTSAQAASARVAGQ
jgi:transposase